ncbi:MAG: hypothetical protein ACPGUE_11110 [Marinomonas sp.]
MKIETDQYLITSDKFNFIVQLKKSREDSHLLEDKSKIGEQILTEKRFYPTLEQAYQYIAKQLVLDSETIESLNDIKSLLDYLIESVEGLKK